MDLRQFLPRLGEVFQTPAAKFGLHSSNLAAMWCSYR
jgi:hypothetical protein